MLKRHLLLAQAGHLFEAALALRLRCRRRRAYFRDAVRQRGDPVQMLRHLRGV